MHALQGDIADLTRLVNCRRHPLSSVTVLHHPLLPLPLSRHLIPSTRTPHPRQGTLRKRARGRWSRSCLPPGSPNSAGPATRPRCACLPCKPCLPAGLGHAQLHSVACPVLVCQPVVVYGRHWQPEYLPVLHGTEQEVDARQAKRPRHASPAKAPAVALTEESLPVALDRKRDRERAVKEEDTVRAKAAKLESGGARTINVASLALLSLPAPAAQACFLRCACSTQEEARLLLKGRLPSSFVLGTAFGSVMHPAPGRVLVCLPCMPAMSPNAQIRRR